MDLIRDHPSQFISTDEVEQELLKCPAAHQEIIRYRNAIQNRYLVQTQLQGLDEKNKFDDLERRNQDVSRSKELGPGDCSVLAVAYHRKYRMATRDQEMCRYAENASGYILPILGTRTIMQDLLQAQKLTHAEANRIYRRWNEETDRNI